MEIFADDELREKLWKDTVKRNRRDKAPYPNPTDVYECHRINTGAIVPFKASTAKYIYKKFNATSVLDFTAGWGGRLLGASSLGLKYTGYDTNTNLKKGYDDMMELLNIQNCEMRWKSSAGEDFSDVEYDLILTSPPYVNMELYENMTPFESDAKFYNEFLIPLMNSAFDGMKFGGHMCINISPKMYDALILHGFRGCDEKIDLRQQLGQQYKTKSQDYIYVWKKEEDEDEDEDEEPSKDEIIAKLRAEIINIQSCLKGYWSDGELGDVDAWRIPDEWIDELEELSKYEDDEVDYYIDAGRKVVLKDGTIKNSKD